MLRIDVGLKEWNPDELLDSINVLIDEHDVSDVKGSPIKGQVKRKNISP